MEQKIMQAIKFHTKKSSDPTKEAIKAFTIGTIYAKMPEEPVRGLSSDYYFTGSYERDREIWSVLEEYIKKAGV